MKDTHPVIEEKFFRMIMEKSGEERLRMGFEMCATAIKLVTASILQDAPHSSNKDVKVAIFERLYGKDLLPEIRRKVVEKIKMQELSGEGP